MVTGRIMLKNFKAWIKSAGTDQLFRSLIRVFPVCYSDKHFVNSSSDNPHFIRERKEKRVLNFRTFTISIHIGLDKQNFSA